MYTSRNVYFTLLDDYYITDSIFIFFNVDIASILFLSLSDGVSFSTRTSFVI